MSLMDKVKQLFDRRGGTNAAKEDAQELKDIATGPGTVGDKAKAAGDALKDPGAPGADAPVGDAPAPASEPATSAADAPEPAAPPAKESDAPETPKRDTPPGG